jgi:c-di-GMP-binding flagellar brake protein YcgR
LTYVVYAVTLAYMAQVNRPIERRRALRVRIGVSLTQYVRERPFRSLAVNVSASGILLQRLVGRRVPLSRIVAVELELPGTAETLWASAEPRFDILDDAFQTSGLTFVNMAHKHEVLLREFVQRKALLALERRLCVRAGSPHLAGGPVRGALPFPAPLG